MVKKIIGLEYLAILIWGIYRYFSEEYSLLMFLLLIFAPDFSIIFYKINSRVGGIGYNFFHTYTLPIGLIMANELFFENKLVLAISIIWICHISMDRFIGYGLKYDNFKETHTQKL